MKRIIILLIGLISVAQAQFAPTSARTRFANGIAFNTRDTSVYNAADSLVVVINRQGRMMYSSTDGLWKYVAINNDTAQMLINYLRKSDTANMLSPYLRKSDTLAMLSPYARTSSLGIFVPYTGAAANLDMGTFRISSRSAANDSILARSSAGGVIATNSGTAVASYGAGGSAEMTFNGFAGYNANRSGSYTARSFTDKNYVDSSLLNRLSVVNVKSYGALGDGIADDRVAIKTAAAVAEQNGLPLYFPSGTYHTSGNLTQATTRTNTTSFSIIFGDNVKIKVIDTANFDFPTSRVLFGYYTGTVPHSFTVTGGNVEIDGNNYINKAFEVSQTTNENLSFKIACANLKIKNLFSNGFANTNTNGIVSDGSYPLMEIRNVTIDSVSRSASINTTAASQAILISGQEGTTLIDNVLIKNIGSTSLTQDCDAIVLRGKNITDGQFASGDFTVQNSYILDSRGRGIKAQSSNVKVFNVDFEQQNLQTFAQGTSIDFQFGNGIVSNCRFLYQSGTTGSSFAPIVLQENIQTIKQISKVTNNSLLTKSVMPRFISIVSTSINSSSADILIQGNSAIGYDTTMTTIFDRGVIEFNANQLELAPPSTIWDIKMLDNTFTTTTNLISYTSYALSDLSLKLKLNLANNINTVRGAGLFNNISGNRISKLSKYRFKGNLGWSNYFPNWTVDFTKGSLMGDNEFVVDLAACTFTNAPDLLPTTNYALITVGDSSTIGQLRQIQVRDSAWSFFLYESKWVARPTSSALLLFKSDSLSGGYTSWNLTKKKIDSLGSIKVNGSGIANQIAYWSNTSTIQGSTNFTYDNNLLRFIVGNTFGSIENGSGAAINPNINATTLSGSSSIAVLVNDGTNNRRAGLFVDQTNALWGLSASQTSVPIPFVIRLNAAERFRIATNGNASMNGTFTASGLIRSGGTSTQALIADGSVQTLTSGTYTPTLTNGSNVSSSSASTCFWTRVGNVVTVSGWVSITHTTNENATVLGISLPVSSNLTAFSELSGSGNNYISTSGGQLGKIEGDATNDRATLTFYPFFGSGSANQTQFTFTYRVL